VRRLQQQYSKFNNARAKKQLNPDQQDKGKQRSDESLGLPNITKKTLVKRNKRCRQLPNSKR